MIMQHETIEDDNLIALDTGGFCRDGQNPDSRDP
jgi:hypothetical protein